MSMFGELDVVRDHALHDRLRHARDRVLEHLLAVHRREVLRAPPSPRRVMRGWCALAGYSVHRISASLPSAWMCVDRIMCWSSVARPTTTAPAPSPNSTVTSRPAVETSRPGRVDLRADQQDVLEHAGADVRVGDRQPVDEARALLADVEARDLLQPERALHEHAGAREVVVRRQRRVDDQVDVLRLEPGALDRLLARLRAERGAGLARLDPVPLLDAGPLDDPLVRRLHLLSRDRGW